MEIHLIQVQFVNHFLKRQKKGYHPFHWLKSLLPYTSLATGNTRSLQQPANLQHQKEEVKPLWPCKTPNHSLPSHCLPPTTSSPSLLPTLNWSKESCMPILCTGGRLESHETRLVLSGTCAVLWVTHQDIPEGQQSSRSQGEQTKEKQATQSPLRHSPLPGTQKQKAALWNPATEANQLASSSHELEPPKRHCSCFAGRKRGRAAKAEWWQEACGEKEETKGNHCIWRLHKKREENKVSEGTHQLSENKAVHHPKQGHQGGAYTLIGWKLLAPPWQWGKTGLKALPFAQKYFFSKEQKGLVREVK